MKTKFWKNPGNFNIALIEEAKTTKGIKNSKKNGNMNNNNDMDDENENNDENVEIMEMDDEDMNDNNNDMFDTKIHYYNQSNELPNIKQGVDAFLEMDCFWIAECVWVFFGASEDVEFCIIQNGFLK